eukprot:CAMPEP_0182947946 /NCGR_PEP_ID=MMETSP0105_2-20130417/59419_1 /TAXON_ID=81532 ORGANISM="Acanthoeca-like sp., Strain 10tr" /NCGR_SAMPLE_ID=MMETSP0105_2 /ASSEMBLY_ACC=CAM_ASM_000205 /LENGTH=99 /DNA_ID=CAMNT_0025088225 /DNA_START=44 /DNA_END=343 /DNA_ORIENTATION=-
MAAAVPTSKKISAFVDEGLRDPKTQAFKPVTAMGGVGKATEGKLAEINIKFAYELIGHYMSLSMNGDMMTEWLTETVGIQAKYAGDIVFTCKSWCDEHL